MMGLESALWEATRPAFRVRYIHNPGSTPRVRLYASYGAATGPTALAKLARIVRKAPEVMVTTTSAARARAAVARSASVLASLRSTTLAVAAGTTGARHGIADDRIPASEAGHARVEAQSCQLKRAISSSSACSPVFRQRS